MAEEAKSKKEEMEEETFDVVVLNDDEGNEHEFMHLATLGSRR